MKINIESCEKQKNTLLMLKLIAQGERDIKNGHVVDQEEFFKKMDERF